MSNSSAINARRFINITNSAPVAVYDIDKDAMIRIYPTSAGTATVYSSGSPQRYVAADIAAGNAAVAASTNASWTEWAAGAITSVTVLQATMPQTAIAVVVTSGTWTVEVTQ